MKRHVLGQGATPGAGRITKAFATACLATALLAGAGDACDTTVGMVMELTGPAGAYGQAGAKAVDMAFRDLNEAGKDRGCTLVTDTRDSQSQSNVAVDQANQLVSVKHVPVIIGGIISSVTIPILTSVTGPAKVVQVSPASSSPTLTDLARDGMTQGYFFRTITSDALQGIAAAKYAMDSGLKRVAIIDVNNDFGVNLEREFARAYRKLGGKITTVTSYNENQPDYSAEVTAALTQKPDALYLISYPVDGATIARAWISQGGPQKFLLNDGMNSQDFIDAVGAKYLDGAYGTSSGTNETASTAYFYANFAKFSGGIAASAPAADRSYDAGAIVGLAIALAEEPSSENIRNAIPKVVDPEGEPVFAGPDGFRKALDLIGAGKPIRYEGVIGPVTFDKNGDISGPFRLWQIEGGKVVTKGEMTAAEVAKLKSGL